MIQCRYCGRPCGCHANDPCVCWDPCPDCDVKPDEEPLDYDDMNEVEDIDHEELTSWQYEPDYDDGGES